MRDSQSLPSGPCEYDRTPLKPISFGEGTSMPKTIKYGEIPQPIQAQIVAEALRAAVSACQTGHASEAAADAERVARAGVAAWQIANGREPASKQSGAESADERTATEIEDAARADATAEKDEPGPVESRPSASPAP